MMLTQRASISAVCGYSSLSIMFLSAVSAISRARERGHPGGHERREVQPRLPVEQQLAGDQLVRRSLSEAAVAQLVDRQRGRAASMSRAASGMVWRGRCLESGIEAPWSGRAN